MRLQTSLYPDRELKLTWSMSLPSTSTIEQSRRNTGRAGCPAHRSCRHNPQSAGSLSSDTQQGHVSNEEKAERNGELPSLGRTSTTNHRTDSQDRKNQGQRSQKVGGSKERRCPQSATGICQSCSCCSPSL